MRLQVKCSKRVKRWISILFIGLTIWIILPVVSFHTPKSTVLFGRNDELIGATLAQDQQWRFPDNHHIGDKFKEALITCEDENFYHHIGVDFKSTVRAIYLNMKYGKVVSGASTLTMQVSRMALGNRSRNIWNKFYESVLAIKLDILHSKEHIIRMYANNAPYGGNIVGIEAASWRYFGCASTKLTWAESATLAVLPNAPAVIYPGRNNKLLKQKRDRLLKKLYAKGKMDKQSYELSLLERIPSSIRPFPKKFMHALQWTKRISPGNATHTSLDINLQNRIQSIVSNYSVKYRANGIYNIGVLVMSVETGEVISYIGNVDWDDPNQGAVDMVQAKRSSGSLLKPFLYAAMQDASYITPYTIIPDYPIFMNGYAPKNFDHKFRGAVAANQALSESLNVPSVFMLRSYSTPRFLSLLKHLGMSSFSRSADYYGLSLILGGGESSLWQMVGAYASMARALETSRKEAVFSPNIIKGGTLYKRQDMPLSKAAIWNTFKALQTVNRPMNEVGWKYLDSYEPLAWKTGTSYGFKDAWAIGTNPKYAIGVWVGNATGEGRPACTGVLAAAPLLFDIYHLLPKAQWFQTPSRDLEELAVCHESGFRASKRCARIDTILVGKQVFETEPCPYHQDVMLDETESFRVNSSNYPISKMVKKKWFILPPQMAYYYKKYHADYVVVPPRLSEGKWNTENTIGIIYPSKGIAITVPRDFNGKPTEVILRATSSHEDEVLYWFLDGENIGMTEIIHQVAISPEMGSHRLVIQDDKGNEASVKFTVN
ncbi:penicillin-binding protein 1C [Halosquirtibacter xylanolyticus]|uniref:penicillin-binding protein 1C n=1 Tax=Halosquirtibacter xylanolyticus TaxID=3374599 RepID=UPI003747866E|nr:penicillin-binding protein 1C [Prolixibacteraceae bacterium]